jgi:chromosome partitioning protein
MKIVIAHHKGGVGKTTLAIHVAGVLAEDGFDKVLVMDCDTQGDSYRFFTGILPEDEEIKEGKDEVDVLWNPNRDKLAIKDRFTEYDHIVVDVDTRVQNGLEIIREIVPDMILIPINKDYLSLLHIEDLLKTLALQEGVINYPATVKIVQMGSNHDLNNKLSELDSKPKSLYFDKVPNLPHEFNESLRDCEYIWNNPSITCNIKKIISGVIYNA